VTSPTTFDAFISYSRKDLDFAKALEQALERYTPPREIRAERRAVAICRDQDDLTGPEYHAAIDQHLTRSRKLIVICSPAARASEYVNDEIRRFGAIHGSSGIISILLAGTPNNAAGEGDAANLAFPDALCELVSMPLAISYTGFEPRRDRVSRGVFYGAWYTLLANLLDTDRAAIEERDRRRKARVRNSWIGGASGVIAALTALTFWALIERQTAIRRGQVTLAQRLAAQTKVPGTLEPAAAERRALVGVEAVRRLEALGEPTIDAAGALRDASAIVAGRVLHLDAGQRDVVFSGDGLTAFAANGPNVGIYNLRDGARSATLLAARPVESLFASGDGRSVGAVTDDGRLALWRGPGWKAPRMVTVPDSLRAVCGALSADGRYVATLALDRRARRTARLLVRRGDSSSIVAEMRIVLPNDSLLPPARADCLQLGTDHLVARYRTTDTSAMIAAALWEWRPDSERDPSLLNVRFPTPRRSVMREWHGITQLAWGTDSTSLVVLDTARSVTRVSLGTGADQDHRGANDIAGVSADGELLVRTHWEEDPYVPLLKSWTFTAIEQRSGTEAGVVAETNGGFWLAPDGAEIVTASGTRVRLWRTQGGREVLRIATRAPVTRIVVSPAARFIATWDSSRAIDVWDVAQASELVRVPRGRVAAASANGRRIAVGTSLGVSVIDGVTGASVASVPLSGGAAFVALNAGGRYLVASGGDPRGLNFGPERLRTLVLDLTGAPDTVFAGDPATGAEFSPDGQSLLLGTGDSVVRLIPLPDRVTSWQKRFDVGRATRFVFSADGRTAAIVLEPPIRSTAVAVVISTQTGAELRRVPNRASNALALSSDGTEVATATQALVEVTRVSDGVVVTRLAHPSTLETVRHVAFLPGNRMMTVAGSLASMFLGASFFTEQAVLVWDRASGRIEHRLPEGADRASDYTATLGEEEKPYFAEITWSPNGREVAAVVFPSRLNYWVVPATLTSPDLKVWRLDGPAPEEIFRANADGSPRLVGVNDSAGLLFTADGALRAWSYRAGALLTEACRRITRRLTTAEWRTLISPDEEPRATCPVRR
jgi:WD40 repeat protein